MLKLSTTSLYLFCLTAILLLGGCGGAIDATIGGTVTGLSGDTSVVLLNNGTDALTVSASGSFTFGTEIEAGSTYDVTVETEPVGETCTVTSGSGTVSQNSGDVTSVVVTCVANITATNDVFGTVTGLATGTSVTLLNNDTSSVTVSTNGSFVFPTALSVGSTYSVTVSANPTGETCTVANATGTIPSSGTITTVVVTCS
ncbi:MAG TPA: hypothetical protein VK832_08620 [Burkholderiaceae bacterium]|jgi:hypothetical protein|nr:hypothetical protein [Burkholderiaceae bacterium]